MTPDSEKTRDELLVLVQQLRDKVADLEQQREKALAGDLEMSRLIVERSPVILFRRRAGEKPTLEYVSENIRRFGYDPESFLAGKIEFIDIVHPDDRERLVREAESYHEENLDEYTMVYRCVTRDGDTRWIEDSTTAVLDASGAKTHYQGILYDITERYLAEKKVRQSEEKYRRIVETAAEGYYMVDTSFRIVDVNRAFCQMTGYTREDLLGADMAKFAEEKFMQYMRMNREKLLSQDQRELEGVMVAKDGSKIPVLLHGNNLHENGGETIGYVAFITNMTGPKRALALAAEVQKSLLPGETPRLKGVDIAGRNISCDEVGGDYYDFITKGTPGSPPLRIIVSDIAGHGVDAALFMATARAFFRMRVSQPGSLSSIAAEMNQHLGNDMFGSGNFMTMFLLSVFPDIGRIEWVRAGHDAALLYDPLQDEFKALKGGGVALGVVDNPVLPQHQYDGVKQGQIIAIGTDGMWEARNLEGEMFGKERLKACIRKHAGGSAQEILDGVYEELSRFTVGCRSEDDLTLVILKFVE